MSGLGGGKCKLRRSIERMARKAGEKEVKKVKAAEVSSI